MKMNSKESPTLAIFRPSADGPRTLRKRRAGNMKLIMQPIVEPLRPRINSTVKQK